MKKFVQDLIVVLTLVLMVVLAFPVVARTLEAYQASAAPSCGAHQAKWMRQNVTGKCNCMPKTAVAKGYTEDPSCGDPDPSATPLVTYDPPTKTVAPKNPTPTLPREAGTTPTPVCTSTPKLDPKDPIATVNPKLVGTVAPCDLCEQAKRSADAQSTSAAANATQAAVDATRLSIDIRLTP